MRNGLRAGVLLAVALAWSGTAHAAAQIVHVPEDVSTLQGAIALMAEDGDVIELAAGTYNAPGAADDVDAGTAIAERQLGAAAATNLEL